MRMGSSIPSLYSAYFNFSRNVAVCGVGVGMTVDAMQQALPGVRLADGETGEPNERGFVGYQANPASLNATVRVSMKDGKVFAITLSRVHLEEALARRHHQDAERRAELDRRQELASRWKTIKETDQMLLSWAEHCSPWTDSSPQRFVRFARWLVATSDPDVWHVVATGWNWDYSHAPLLWIIRQESCDLATALEIFFLAEPSYYFRWVNDRSSVPDNNLEMFDFLAEIYDLRVDRTSDLQSPSMASSECSTSIER